jgi:hypothetical protein
VGWISIAYLDPKIIALRKLHLQERLLEVSDMSQLNHNYVYKHSSSTNFLTFVNTSRALGLIFSAIKLGMCKVSMTDERELCTQTSR